MTKLFADLTQGRMRRHRLGRLSFPLLSLCNQSFAYSREGFVRH